MSDRLTDAALVELEDIALLRLSAADREAGMRMDGQVAIAVRDQAAKRYLANLVIELRERRATDLTAKEVEALRWLRDTLVSERPYHSFEFKAARNEPAIAVLDKLIAGAPR